MSTMSRRTLITAGLAAAAGASGLGVAARLAARAGLVPPDAGGLYGAGTTLTYAAQRLMTRHTLAQAFSRDQISQNPFANEVAPLGAEFDRLAQGGFADWRLAVEGMVARPTSFSVAELKRAPGRSDTTLIACEEGWDYVAEWSGVPLAHVLETVGTHPQARYVVYQSIQPSWWESIDMAEATHPQTLVAYEMNGRDLPVPFGGPLRLRVPRQLGYKSVKYITRLIVTDDLAPFGKGVGGMNAEDGYSWYAGI